MVWVAGRLLYPLPYFPTEKEHKSIGLWLQRHKCYLIRHRWLIDTTLLTSGKWNTYLVDIDKPAEDMFFRLVKQMKQSQDIDITEQLKEENALE